MAVYIPEAAAQRALTRYTPGADGCLISTYSIGSHGYAQVGWSLGDGRNQMTTAHRGAWVAYTGQQIPEGMTVHHICHVRRCVNPSHLRLLSNSENAAENGQKSVNKPTGTFCLEGHPLVASESRRSYCRPCQNRRRRRRRSLMTEPP